MKISPLILLASLCVSNFVQAETTQINVKFLNKSIQFKTLPLPVQNDLKIYFIRPCFDFVAGENKPSIKFGHNFLKIVDFDGNGHNDYVLESREASCNGSNVYYTGNSEGNISIILNDGLGNYRREVDSYLMGGDDFQLVKENNQYMYRFENGSYINWNQPIKRIVFFNIEDNQLTPL